MGKSADSKQGERWLGVEIIPPPFGEIKVELQRKKTTRHLIYFEQIYIYMENVIKKTSTLKILNFKKKLK